MLLKKNFKFNFQIFLSFSISIFINITAVAADAWGLILFANPPLSSSFLRRPQKPSSQGLDITK